MSNEIGKSHFEKVISIEGIDWPSFEGRAAEFERADPETKISAKAQYQRAKLVDCQRRATDIQLIKCLIKNVLSLTISLSGEKKRYGERI